MIKKNVICPQRLRRVPKKFSWLDHRLVRDGHIRYCTTEGLALYLFLVTVSDAEGLSYYSDKSLCTQLNVAMKTLFLARKELIKQGLIAYERPIYQVLDLTPEIANYVNNNKTSNISSSKTNSPSSCNQNHKAILPEKRHGKTLHVSKIINEIERKLKR